MANPHPTKALALVTGATSGIGRAIALALARDGYPVLALGRNATALADLARAAPSIEPLALDLADGAATIAALSGREIGILVNNAGMMPRPGPFDAMDPAEITRTVEVNLTAVMRLTHLLLPGMRARKAGHLFFTGSTAGHAPGANFAVYSATKAAISALAAALRAELSPDCIRVTELVPGRVETALYAGALPDAARQALYADATALQPDDIAQAVLAVLHLPERAAVTRLDILPTRPVPPMTLK